MNSAPSPSCALRVAGIAEALCRAVGHAFGRGLMQGLMAVAICRRIQRMRGLLLAIEARFLAGRMRVGALGLGGKERVAPRVVVGEAVRLPRRFAWLCLVVPGEAACFAGQMRVVLAEPGMQALLAACPQAVRALRPVCFMLGIARADYVPGQAETAVAIAPSDVPPRPETQAAMVAAPWLTLDAAGMGWVRFVPG